VIVVASVVSDWAASSATGSVIVVTSVISDWVASSVESSAELSSQPVVKSAAAKRRQIRAKVEGDFFEYICELRFLF
jgi:hypothetical protein